MTTLDIDNAIRSRAYEFWQAEGGMPGRELDYWLKAEAEIKALVAPATKPAPKAPRKAVQKAKAKA